MKRSFKHLACLNRIIDEAIRVKNFKAFEESTLKLRKMEIADGVAIGTYRARGI